MSDDGLDLESQITLLAGRMVAGATDEPAVIAHWVLIVDVRGEDYTSNIGMLTPTGMPEWIRDAMLRETVEYDFVPPHPEGVSEDDDEG